MSHKEQIEQELQAIKKAGKGVVNPRDVVRYAKDPKTALHSEFEWDDTKASEAYRLEQARRVLRVYVTVIYENHPPVRVWTSLPSDRKAGGGYRATVDVLSDADLRAELIQSALVEMEVFQRKYSALKELGGVFSEMRKADRQLAKKLAKSA